MELYGKRRFSRFSFFLQARTFFSEHSSSPLYSSPLFFSKDSRCEEKLSVCKIAIRSRRDDGDFSVQIS